MTWTCSAINHGVAIFPDNRIRPCCQISADYSKPISSLSDPARFADLADVSRPDACRKCWENEDNGNPSYRQFFLGQKNLLHPGINFLDLRHSNQCNLKCRYCNPHFSNQWARELGYHKILEKSDLMNHADVIITESLQDVYWCGGEPLIMKDHFDFLIEVINRDYAKNISLRYNSNLTQINYKNTDFVELWKQFKNVSIGISLDAAGPELNSIRSGSDWNNINANIKKLREISNQISNINLWLTPTVSMLNIWFLPELFRYAKEHSIAVKLNVLTGPDYLSLDAIHPTMQSQAKNCIETFRSMIPDSTYHQMISMLSRDDNEYLFLHAVRHILLLDKIRDENLFDILPYRDLAIDLTLKNREYE
jgi:sulfatase maturation enzyme AslB (radical SAM superfamily)